ncbi:30S ribosomal protein S18 [Candidatus Roizmanbacteria bacterium RIFCSPLOWO2_01_FULL_40_14]|nr:MAG: 30S ribosomal protein S18 [Candidatus Roizmanbacteria bacterium RIFCSPLOWO2_01_FULL_40_14]
MPDYKKWEVLSNFISERGKIYPGARTGLDAKTQRRLTREVKRARHLALLPFVVRPL